MKFISIIAGLLLCISSLFSIIRYFSIKGQFSDYDLGFVAGKLALLAVGILLLVTGILKMKK